MKSLLLFLALASPLLAQQPQRVEFPTQCGPGGCSPGWGSCQPQYYQPRQQQGPQPDGNFTPPVGSQGTPQFSPCLPSPPPLPTPPGVQNPPCPPQPTIDWAAFEKQQKERHDALLAAQAEGFKSIVVAINGNKCNCQPTDLTEINTKLDALAVSCKPTTPAPPAQLAAEEHVVVVADHNAPYWQRLAEAMQQTKKTYHGVQEAQLPAFPVGIHPQAVVYRNSVPVRIVKGQYEVEGLLSRLARGEPI